MNAKNNKYQRLHRNETEIQLHMCIRIGYRKKIHIYSFAIIQMNTKTPHEKCKKKRTDIKTVFQSWPALR